MNVRLTTTTQLLAALHRSPAEPAWETFVDRYRPVLIGVARRLGLSAEDAMDAAQQTLLEFVRDFRAGRFDRERSRLRDWIMGILRHRVHDVHRARSRDARGASEPPASLMDDPAQLEAHWQVQVERRIFEEAIAMLRSQSGLAQRSLQAFELTALRGVPPEAAAQECSMSVDGVYVARSRVAARLRQIVSALEAAYEECPRG